MEINQILLKPSAVARALGAAAFLLVLVSTAGQLVKFLTGHDELLGLISLTFVDEEQNVPTLFSALLWAFAALCSAVVTVLARKRKAPDVWRWAVLSMGFLYIAFDEGLALHERLRVPLSALLGSGELDRSYLAIRGLAAAVVLTLLFWGFLRRLPAKTRFTFVAAAFLFLGGAVGFDLVGAHHAESHGGNNSTYAMIATVEESLEMAGVIVLIYGLLTYLAENYKEVRFRLDASEESSRSKPPTF